MELPQGGTALPCPPAQRRRQPAVMCHSKLISGDVKRTVKDTEDVDVAVVPNEVGDSVMPVENDAHVARRCPVALAYLWKSSEVLRPIVDALDGAGRGWRVFCGDVLEDVLEPTLSLRSPAYLCHERIRRAVSSFEMMRFASESASPRSTMM